MDNGIQEIGVSKTYPQNWRAYNAAQTGEKTLFLKLLHDLCANIPDAMQSNGRPRLSIGDMLFAVSYKIYSGFSGRRFMSDLGEAKDSGYINRKPHFNSLFNYLENPQLTPILHNLIEQTSLPLQAIETDFAADSSGFSSSRYSRWYDYKYGEQKQSDWVKVHLMCGVKTNIVTSVVIKDMHASDTRQLPELVKTTAKNFEIDEVSADKAYGSIVNYDAISSHGATPFIAFKENHTGRGISGDNSKASKLWRNMFHFFKYNEEEFQAHYHKRSNVETTFSMIKAKFGGSVRSKTDTAMKNECLVKVLCHNLCVLIQEMHELGIDVNFSAQKVSSG